MREEGQVTEVSLLSPSPFLSVAPSPSLHLPTLPDSDPPVAPGYSGPLIHSIHTAMGPWRNCGREVKTKLLALGLNMQGAAGAPSEFDNYSKAYRRETRHLTAETVKPASLALSHKVHNPSLSQQGQRSVGHLLQRFPRSLPQPSWQAYRQL